VGEKFLPRKSQSFLLLFSQTSMFLPFLVRNNGGFFQYLLQWQTFFSFFLFFFFSFLSGSQVAQSRVETLLYMEVYVISDATQQKVLRCFSCTQREKKLWSKKNKHSKNTADFSKDFDQNDEETSQERIIIFHNSPYVEFINNEVLLRARLTCYCRHHEEKTGFRFAPFSLLFFFFFLFFLKFELFVVVVIRIVFKVKNQENELVAQGRSPPIMITDDHKPSRKLKRLAQSQEDDESDLEDSETSPPPLKKAFSSRRQTKDHTDEEEQKTTSPQKTSESRAPFYALTPASPFPAPYYTNGHSHPPLLSPFPLKLEGGTILRRDSFADAHLLAKFAQGHYPSSSGSTASSAPVMSSVPLGLPPILSPQSPNGEHTGSLFKPAPQSLGNHNLQRLHSNDSPSPHSFGRDNNWKKGAILLLLLLLLFFVFTIF
jgi:hypothetical protein